MEKLIVKPLMAFNNSTLITIDGLDECEDKETVSAILSAIGEFSPEIPNVKFFITSRPKPHIREGFQGLPRGTLKTIDLRVWNQTDVRKYLEVELPIHYNNCVDEFCGHADGLFIYTNAMFKFLFESNYSPEKQIPLFLESPESCLLHVKMREGRTISSLYMTTLLEDVGNCETEDSGTIRSVLGAVALATYPISPSTIAILLGFGVDTVNLCLESIQSLLIFKEGSDGPVQPIHKSFSAFLTHETKCADKFYVSPVVHHQALLIGCLMLMNEKLNKEIDLRTDDALKYACKSWHKHLVGTGHTDNVPDVIRCLDLFLDKILTWEHALGVFGETRAAVDGRRDLRQWLDKVSSALPY